MSVRVVTEEAVRKYLMDMTYAQNDLADDLSFSSEEIEEAMEGCAREFNGIFPMVLSVQAHCMPMHTNVFLDGTAASLLRSHIFRLSKNDVKYQAGNVTVDVDGNMLKHFRDLEQKHQRRFYDVALNMQHTANLNNGFGQVG